MYYIHIWTIRAIPTYRVYRLYDYGFIGCCRIVRMPDEHVHVDDVYTST